MLLLPALACNLLLGDLQKEEVPGGPAATHTRLAGPPNTEPAPLTSTSTPSVDASFIAFTDDTLGLAFRYPPDWALREEGASVVIASDAGLLDSATFDRQGAGMILETRPLPDSESAPETVLREIIVGLGLDDAPNFRSGPALMMVGDQEAVVATVEGAAGDGGQTLFYYVAMVQGEAQAVLATGVTLPADAEHYGPLLWAIVGTIELSEPVGPVLEGTLRFGEPVTGTVQSGRGSAWQFRGEQGMRIDLVAEPVERTLDLTLDVRDATGDSILQEIVDEAFGAETIEGLALPQEGDYLVVVGGFAGSAGIFTLTLSDAGELADASPLLLEDRLTGEIGRDESADYLFTAASEGEVTVIVDPAAELDVVVEVLDPEQGVILEEDGSFGRETLTFSPVPGVTYTIRVRGFAGASGRFSITLTSGSAGVGSAIVASGRLIEGGESDPYPFFAPEGTTITAQVEPAGVLDVLVEIWQEGVGLLETVDLAFGAEDVSFSVPITATYRIEVRGLEGAGGDYTISLTGGPDVIFEITYDDVVDGKLGENAFLDYTMRLNPEDRVRFTVANVPEMDPVLELFDEDGNFLQEADVGGTGVPENLIFTAPAESESGARYLLRVRDFEGDADVSFTLTVASG